MLVVLLSACLLAAGPEEPWKLPPSVSPQLLEGPVAKLGKDAPARIVSLAPSATELVFALGQGARVVGVTRYDDEPPEARALPKVGGFLDPSVEAVLALRPNLVLAAPNREIRPRLQRLVDLGVPVLVLPGNALQDLWWSTHRLAAVFDLETRARGHKMLDSLERELIAIRDRRPKATRPRVALAYGQAPLVLAGPGSLAHQLLDLAGASNVVKIERSYPVYSMEQLAMDAPEIILDASSEHGADASFWTRYRVLDAVRHGRVVPLTSTSLLRVGPRIGEALRSLADAIDAAGSP